MKDKDLEGFLQSLRVAKPESSSVDQWKNAVHAELKRAPVRRSSRWLELTAAMILGILIGAFAFKARNAEENYAGDATIEFVVTKSH